jgi:hypothetical protein
MLNLIDWSEGLSLASSWVGRLTGATPSMPADSALAAVGATKQVTADHHDPLVTYYLSATSLQLRPASPQQHPGTHVARLPLSGLAPLTAATYMPNEWSELSSRGFESYMVKTVEFLKVGAAADAVYACAPCASKLPSPCQLPPASPPLTPPATDTSCTSVSKNNFTTEMCRTKQLYTACWRSGRQLAG